MRRKKTLIIAVLALTLLGIWLFPEARSQLAIDRCLDAGGAYHESRGECNLPDAAAPADLDERLVDFYAADLDHGYFLPRIHALAGLGHLEAQAAETVPRIAALAEKSPTVERLIALWVLARIGTPEALRVAEAKAAEEKDKLLEGRPAAVAARVAYLTALPGQDARRPELDRALPALYNAARGEELEARLLAAWALYQFDAAVTIEVARGSLRAAAGTIDPEHGNFTRHLTYARLIGPPAAEFMSERLAQIARRHDFGADLFARRARTVFTLAALTSFDHPVVREYRQRLPRRLDSLFERSGALDALLVLGPYACNPALAAELREIAAGDEDDRKKAERALKLCPSP